MADKVTFDFENEIITWNTDSQQGTELCPGLKEKKPAILKVIGYEMIDFSTAIDTINDFINGEIATEEFQRKLGEFER